MFDLVAVWFVIGMFVAGCWIIVGAWLPAAPRAELRGRKRARPRE